MWEMVVIVAVVGGVWSLGMLVMARAMKQVAEGLATSFQKVLSPGADQPEMPLTSQETAQMEMTSSLPWEMWDAEAEGPAQDPFTPN